MHIISFMLCVPVDQKLLLILKKHVVNTICLCSDEALEYLRFLGCTFGLIYLNRVWLWINLPTMASEWIKAS